MRGIVVLLFLIYNTVPAFAQIDGNWYAVLQAGPQQIPLDLELRSSPEGLTGSLLSPAQSAVRMPITAAVRNGDSLDIQLSNIGIHYTGVYTEDRLTGTFHQGGFSAPLTFYRRKPEGYDGLLTPIERPVRPQDPTDFPYERESVNFGGGAQEVRLSGELTLPDSGTPHAAILLVSGSGPQNRNEDMGPSINHRPFLVLSDFLTRNGYAVLRYDDRGAAESTGDFQAATSADLADDAAAAFTYLRSRFSGRDLPMGIAGHSEGGMIAPMIAAENDQVDFLILLAAPGLPIDELMTEQRQMLAHSLSPLFSKPVMSAAVAYLKAHPELSPEDFRTGLTDTIVSVIPSLPPNVRQSILDEEVFAQTYVQGISSPWMRFFLAYDPAPALRRVTVPVLAINGLKDTQVSARNLDTIASILKEAGNEDVTTVGFPDLNHLFQPAKTGLPDEYGQIETTLHEDVLQSIVSWLNERFR